jgi:hypothetical protein
MMGDENRTRWRQRSANFKFFPKREMGTPSITTVQYKFKCLHLVWMILEVEIHSAVFKVGLIS